jgi:hypothetical protein
MLPKIAPCSIPSFLSLLTLFTPTSAYPTTGTTSLIPWSETTDIRGVPNGIPFTFSDTPHARIRLSHSASALGPAWEGEQLSFSVDTGTCGIVTNHNRTNLHVSEETSSNEGQEWLSSSKILYIGYWVPRNVTFVHSKPGVVKTYQPVLAVTKKLVNCVWWEPSYGNDCPGATEETDFIISIIGIGYGRSYDGQPQGLPDKNPLLKIDSIDSVALNSIPTFHPGWRVDEKGIQVGLLDSIWNDPSRPTRTDVQLPTPIPPPPPATLGRNPHFDWQEVRGCVKFPPITGSGASTPCISVALLLDTGINWSSIRVDSTTAVSVRDATTKHVKTDQIVDVFAVSPAVTSRVQLYKFTTTGSEPAACYWTPEYTSVTSDPEHGRRNFTNTGRRAFRVWGFTFDPVNGRVGFQRRADTCAVTSPSYPGMFP